MFHKRVTVAHIVIARTCRPLNIIRNVVGTFWIPNDPEIDEITRAMDSILLLPANEPLPSPDYDDAAAANDARTGQAEDQPPS